MDVLIVGGDSKIGAVAARWLTEAGMTVAATTRRRELRSTTRPLLDLEDDPRNWDLPAADICVLAAARARMADCETDPESTQRVNASAPAILARRMADRGSLVALLSTNQVFDGGSPLRKPDDPTAPLTAYGRQKAEAEAAIRSLAELGTILRLTKVLTADLPLVHGWLGSLAQARPIFGFSDMRLAPVRVEKVAEALELICRGRLAGVFQASGDRDVSYSAFARRVALAAGADPALAREESGAAAGVIAALRPQHTTLDTRTLAAIGWAPETTEDAITAFCSQALGLRGGA